MNYYPVIIPTLNRYSHFKECVESLARCSHAKETELVIGLDYPPHEKYETGYNKIKSYIYTISGFKKITVFEHKENLGAGRNWKFLMNYCKTYYDAYIGTEDDNVFGPAFLDYMNKALEMFRDDPNITSVSGYNDWKMYDQGKFECYFSKNYGAWGTGYWFCKEEKLKVLLSDNSYFENALHSRIKAKKIIATYPCLYSMLNYMIHKKTNWGDVKRTTINILENTYQIKPAISLVRNCGYDGSGIHCGYADGYSTQIINESPYFDFKNGVGSADTESNRNNLFNHSLPENAQDKDRYLESIKRLFRDNTNLFWHCFYIFKDKCYKLRCRIAFRKRINRCFPFLTIKEL